MEASHPAELNTFHHFLIYVKQNSLTLLSQDTAKVNMSKIKNMKLYSILKAPISSSTEDKGQKTCEGC